MVGPRSTRYTYWLVRIAGALDGTLGRTVLLPGDLDRAVQYSDARSIAAWSVRMLAEGRGGTYNAVGPGRPDTLREVLDACAVAAGAGSLADLDTVVAPEDLMRRKLLGVDEEERPLWFPRTRSPSWPSTRRRRWRPGWSSPRRWPWPPARWPGRGRPTRRR